MKAYINYPNPRITLHWNDTCSEVQKNRKEGQRVVMLNPDTIESALGRFVNRGFSFASNPDENDMWLDISLGSPRHDEAVVYVIQSLLGRRYRPLATASVEAHTCA